jgi:thymidine phosphorylase
LVQGKLAADTTAGCAMAKAALADGRAAERFARMVTGLGGPTGLLERPDQHLPQAPVIRPVLADQPGFISAIDVRGMGVAVIELGGGRRAVADTINPAVGLAAVASLGTAVGPGATPLCVIHAANDDDADRVSAVVKQHITITEAAPAPAPVIGNVMDATTP